MFFIKMVKFMASLNRHSLLKIVKKQCKTRFDILTVQKMGFAQYFYIGQRLVFNFTHIYLPVCLPKRANFKNCIYVHQTQG